MSRIITS